MRNALPRAGLFVALLAAAAGAGVGCTPCPSTPAECVAAFSDAYRGKSTRKILALTADPDRLPPPAGGARREMWDRAGYEQEIEKELKDEGMWYRAWCSTRFVSSREHDGHVHVTVDVQYARSEILLVRQDGCLKVHPAPGSVD